MEIYTDILCTDCVQKIANNILFRMFFSWGVYNMLWRRVPESNRCTRICNPLHNHSTNPPQAHINMNDTAIQGTYFKARGHARGLHSNLTGVTWNFLSQRPRSKATNNKNCPSSTGGVNLSTL